MAANIHRVPKKAWNRWPEHAQRTFNVVMAGLARQEHVNALPGGKRLTPKGWATVRWNAAWIAADAAAFVMRESPPFVVGARGPENLRRGSKRAA